MLMPSQTWDRCSSEVREVPQDYPKAVTWLRKAAEQGNTHAHFNLECMCQKGEGVVQNFKEAAMWYKMAAELEIAGL